MLRLVLFFGFVLALFCSPLRSLSQSFIEQEVKVIHSVVVTAYTASKKECGKSDGITASGLRVRKGTVACNFLPCGTKIRIPRLFGNRIFTVIDRMRSDKNNHIDVYVKHRKRALAIGKRIQSIEVLVLS